MRKSLLFVLSIFSIVFALSVKADPAQFYCPSSIICNENVCKPTSGQDIWGANTTPPPGTKPGEYPFAHAEWRYTSPTTSLCNYMNGKPNEPGIYIAAKVPLWIPIGAENSAWWWAQLNSSAYCYPNDLGNSQRCPYTNENPWVPPASKK